MLTDLLHAYPIEEITEAGAFRIEAPLQRSDVRSQRIRHRANVGLSGRHEEPDRLLHFIFHRPVARIDHRPDELTGVSRKGSIGARIAARHVARADDHSVEVSAEVKRTVEKPLVYRSFGRRGPFVAEAHALGPPIVAHH